MVTLGDHLRSLDQRELADLLARRRDVLVEPVPNDVDELYVGVRLVAANGSVPLKVESNRVTGRS